MSRAILASILKKLSKWTPQASTSSSTELPSSAEQELHNLESITRKIHAILEDAEERDVSDESEQLHLRELREVVYDAEDVMDEYEYQVLRKKVEARRQAMASLLVCNKHDKVIFDWNSFHPKVSISNELAGRIKNIRERFEEINDWNRVGLELLEKDRRKRRRINKWTPTEKSSYFDEGKTFGREDEKNEIVKWLLKEDEGDETSVLGIVGMGGLGKTTLAQMAYNDTRVRQHFSLRGWVYVSEDFDVTNLAKKIYNSFDMYRSVHVMSLDELHRAFKEELDGKKFILVLDDVWNLTFDLWSSLKTLFVGVGVGKILVTTRNEHVSKIMQTSPPIYLSHLSFDDSWLLFKKIVFEGQDHDLVEVGKKVVHKCRGLPLAIKVLAGILRKESDEQVWDEVLKSVLWEFDKENDDNIIPILKLSYDRLPIELRQCFMYLCLFPKDSCLDKSVIVQQWMSHGFVQSRGNKMKEDVGNDICNEFLNRSILQYLDASISTDLFIMHDLMHDLAQSVAKDEYLLMTTLKWQPEIPKTIRHVSIDIKGRFEIINLKPLHEAKHLRTLLLSADRAIPITDLLLNLRCLRALDLSMWGSHDVLKQKLPDSIGGLIHLRYLDIGCVDSIPASVYNLHYLQTLKLEFSTCEIKLSRGVGDLVNLRHLYGFDEDHLPREVVGLTNLQTLHDFPVGVESHDMKIRDLKRFPYLRGILNIRGLETVAWSEVTPLERYLKSKQGIDLLRLHWENNADEKVADVDESLAAQVMDSLQPHCDLRDMSIIGYPGVVLPTWLGHELPALKNLMIKGMERVKIFVLPLNPPTAVVSPRVVENQHWFPSLEKLTLTNMHELEEWRGAEDHDLPCLRCLYIEDCPKLRRIPCLPSLTELHLNECSFELLFGCRLPMLRSLNIVLCTGDSLILPSDLNPLEELSITSCEALRSVEGLSNLVSLKSLAIAHCPVLRLPPHECLPIDIHDVEINESLKADEWYQNQVKQAPLNIINKQTEIKDKANSPWFKPQYH